MFFAAIYLFIFLFNILANKFFNVTTSFYKPVCCGKLETNLRWKIQDGCQTLTARPISSDKFITQNIPHLPPSWEKNKSETHTQIQTSRSANIVFVYVPKHYECRSSEMYVCILQWLLKSLYSWGFQADT